MNKQGFTLIEVLAIITILAIIAVITIPVVVNVTTTSRENAFIDSGYSLVSSLRTYQARASATNGMDIDLTVDYTKNKNTDMVNIKSGSAPDGGAIHIDSNGKIELKLWSDTANICIVKSKNKKQIKIDRSIKKNDCEL